MKIKNEKLFILFSHSDTEPTDIGRKQFYEDQSLGRKPVNPDPYYLVLVRGKQSFDFLCSEYRKMYFMGEWWGFKQLWRDWKEERWVLPHLCKWHSIPDWLDKEITEGELLETYGV